MKEELKQQWEEEHKDANSYMLAILKVAEKVMEYLDKGEVIDADKLIGKADEELHEGITGNMAAYIASAVSKYHEKGDEFKRSWNKQYGNENAKGIINPAIFTIETK